MDVHFIDTSVFTNILDVYGRNEKRTEVMSELRELLKSRDKNVLILPYATIIETGNHIAHSANGAMAMRGEGFGDLSIIRAYERYKEETPAIHRIRIKKTSD